MSDSIFINNVIYFLSLMICAINHHTGLFIKSIFRLALILFAFLLPSGAYGQLTADFKTSDTAFCAPGIVFFTNTSIGATSYSWDLGNGVLSSGTDASTSYTSVGTYTVTLVASNGSTTSTKKIIVVAYGPPTISFFANPTNACLKSPITFTSTSTANMWGGLEYTWNFGDGASSTLANPTYAYTSPAYYNITLLAKNKGKCTSSLTKGTYIHALNPIAADFESPLSTFCNAPSTVSFNNLSTGTPTLTYQWFFGDGGTSTLPNPSHTYSTFGNYTVKLITTDGNGCVDSIIKVGFVSIGNFKAEFSSKQIECYNTPLTFIDTGIGARISRQWDFGDLSVGASDTEYHTYVAGGLYNVKLIVFNGFCYDSITKPVRISEPRGSFTITQPCTPKSTLTFTATTSTPSITVDWIFADTTIFIDKVNPWKLKPDTNAHSGYIVHPVYPTLLINLTPPVEATHPYYTTMTMTDTVGCITIIKERDTIHNLALDLSQSKAPATNSLKGCIPLVVNFDVKPRSVISDPLLEPVPLPVQVVPYTYNITSCNWDFGDGSSVLTGTGPNPVHTYTAPGVYTVHCHIVTANGCGADDSILVYAGTKQIATYTMSPSRVCKIEPVFFTSHTTSTLIDEYEWIYYDGKSDKGPGATSATHIFGSSGEFTPELLVYYNGCPSDRFSLPLTIDSPTSIIAYNFMCIPANGIQFADSSAGDDTHLWIFGDGTTSTLDHPTHLFPALSIYIIKLATYNAKSGCRDTTYTGINLKRLSSTSYLELTDSNICRDQQDSVVARINVIFLGIVPYTMAIQDTFFNNWVVTDTSTPYYPNGFDPSLQLDATDHRYPVRGNNKIDLVMLNNHGCLDTISNTILVARPIGKFSSSFVNGCAPVVATFVDSSTDVAGAPIKLHRWDFGDNAIFYDTIATATHNYNTNGHFAINEIIIDTFDCKDTVYSAITPVVNKPVAGFHVSDSANCLRTKIGFANTSTNASKWLWSFGDGATSTLSSPVYVYPSPGTYSVTQVAIDTLGCTDTFTKTNYMNILVIPTASFYMDDSFAICPPLNVNFTNLSTGAVAFQWSFGDGTFSQVANPNDIYGSPGYYTIKLVASNLLGCIDTAIGHADVFGYNGAFSYKPLLSCIGTPINFKATVSGAASMVWDFNDGTTSSLTVVDTIVHTYPLTGRYLPKLILVDSSGCNNFSYGVDTIKVDSLVPDFTFTPPVGCQNEAMNFTDASHSLFSHSAIWSWSFGSGATSTLSNPAYTFTVSGTQPVTLSVTDSAGCSSSITKNISLNPAPAPITGNTILCIGDTSRLFDASTGGTWASSNTSVATVAAGLLTGVTAGTAAITYTLATGCTITTTATINPSPLPITGTAGVCAGATTALSDKTAGGAWSSSNTSLATVGTAGTVTGISAGTLTISYTSSSGCAATRAVTVYPLPGPVKGALQVCRTLTTTLSDTVSGGLWTSAVTTTARIGSSSGLVNALTAGTVTITYKLTATGCAITAVLTVDPQPNAVTGTTVACVAATATLSNGGSAGGAWASGNTTIATIDPVTGIFTGVAAGTATLSYVLPTGCFASKTVTINPLPAPIAGPANVCTATTITLSDATTPGTWSSSNTAVAAISTAGIVTGKVPGTTTITYVIATGCLITGTITVNALPSAITGPAQVCAGFTATLTNSLAGGSWTSGNTAVAVIGSSSGVYTGISTGTSVITYTPGTGCNATDTITVLLQPGIIKGPSEVCKGLSVTLSDSVTGGLWSTSATLLSVGSATGVVTAAAAGTATITYTLPTACFITASLTVNPLPVAITGNTHACISFASVLSDADAGGTWMSGNTSIAAIGSASGSFTGIAAGTAAVTYTLSTGCITTTTVTTDPLPATVTGTRDVCAGLTTALSDASVGGTWMSGNTSIAAIGSSSGSFTGISAGTAAVTYTLPTGCSAFTTVTVNPLPAAITGQFHICAGLSTTLSDADPSGAWTSSNTAIAFINSSLGLLNAVLAGTTAITYTLPTGCITVTTVTVDPLPATVTAATFNVCAGLAITLSDGSAGGTWASGSTTVAVIGSSSGVVTGIVAGTAPVIYTLATGCLITATVTVDPLPASITGPTEVCYSYTITLSDADAGGTWMSSNTAVVIIGSASGVISTIAAGTAAITYTLLTGCITTASVTVNPLPADITGIFSICKGAATVLSDATPGGTWSTNDTAVSIDPLTGIATGINAVTGVVTYTLSTGCFVTATITVNDTPSAITGITYVCAGGTIKLDETLPVGTWMSDNTTVAIVDGTGGVSGVSAGTATISFTGTGGCTAFITVTVYPLMTPIKGTNTLCTGTAVVLSDAMTGGVWASSDTAIAAVSVTGVVTAVAAGSADIKYFADGVCDTAVLHITVNAAPYAGIIRGPSHVCAGSAVQLTDSIAGGFWATGDPAIATVAAGTVTGIKAGTGTISYSYINSCGTDRAVFTITVNPVPDFVRITTHPKTDLCDNTLFQNFGAAVPPAAGVQYIWSATNAVVYATGNDKQYCLVNFNSAGTSIIRLHAGGITAACSSYDSMVYQVSAAQQEEPVVVYYAPEFVCKDNTPSLFQWGYDDVLTLDSTLFEGMVNQNFYQPEPDFAHKYYWVITMHDGCMHKSYYNRPTGVRSNNGHAAELILYPNPADEKITLAVKGAAKADILQARIVDVLGRERKAVTLVNGAATVKLSGLAPGMYLVSFYANGINIGTKPFVKE